jgi:uncharacterized membrane protein
MIIGLVRYKNLEKGVRALVVLCVANCCQTTLSFVLSMIRVRNLELLNDYRPVEIVLLGAVFYLLVQSRLVQRIVVACVALYVLVWLADKFTLDDPSQLNNRMAMLSRLIAIIISIAALYSGQKSLSGSFLRSSLFWVGTAVLLYSSGTLLLLGWSNQLAKSGMDTFITAWQINWVLLIMANLFYMKGLLCKPPRQI